MAEIITYAGIVHSWLCDAMGHLNARYYFAMFDDAGLQLVGHIAEETTEVGWADVRAEIEFKEELRIGKLITIRSCVETIGNSSITCAHVMEGTLDGLLHATMRTVTVRFDLIARKKQSLSLAEREAALKFAPTPVR